MTKDTRLKDYSVYFDMSMNNDIIGPLACDHGVAAGQWSRDISIRVMGAMGQDYAKSIDKRLLHWTVTRKHNFT